MSDKITIAKNVAKFVVSTSVAAVVKNGIKTQVVPSNQFEHVQIVVGAYVIGAMIGDKAIDWADNRFNATQAAIKKYKSDTEETTTEE
ncbi:MAG: hypothetical protein LC687_01730 [Actinobacteria bacterium]|nr:hypothetical protein [Actinomycetota bacterium]